MTDLAALAACERQAAFDHRLGRKRSRAWRRRAEEGENEHRRYSRRLAVEKSMSDPRCFIASAVFGPDANETNALRAWRDLNLLDTAFGRAFVASYYFVSPPIAAVLSRARALRAAARFLLRAFIVRIEQGDSR